MFVFLSPRMKPVMIQEEEDDLAAEEENKIINEVSTLRSMVGGTWRSL